MSGNVCTLLGKMFVQTHFGPLHLSALPQYLWSQALLSCFSSSSRSVSFVGCLATLLSSSDVKFRDFLISSNFSFTVHCLWWWHFRSWWLCHLIRKQRLNKNKMMSWSACWSVFSFAAEGQILSTKSCYFRCWNCRHVVYPHLSQLKWTLKIEK